MGRSISGDVGRCRAGNTLETAPVARYRYRDPMAPFVIAQSSTGGTNGAWGAAGLALLIGMIPFALVTTVGFARYMAAKTSVAEAGKALFIGTGTGLAVCIPVAFLSDLFFHWGFGLGVIVALVLIGAAFFVTGTFLSSSPRTWSAATLVAGGATGSVVLASIIASAFGLSAATPADGSAAYGYLMFAAAIGGWIVLFPPWLLGTALGIIYFRRKNRHGPGHPGQPDPPGESGPPLPPGPPEPP